MKITMFPRFMRNAALACASVFAMSAVSLSAQTVDDIVAKMNDAAGGEKVQRAVKSKEAQYEVAFNGGAIKLPYKLVVQRPGLTYDEATFQGASFKNWYDGKNGWGINPMQGQTAPAPKNEEELKEIEEQADIDGPFIDGKAKGYKIELAGKEDLDGEQAYKLKVTNKHNDVKYFFIGADNYLPVKIVSKRKNKEGGETEFEEYLSDYKKLPNGLVMPHTSESKAKGQTFQTMTLKSITFDKTYEASLFTPPPVKPTEAKK